MPASFAPKEDAAWPKIRTTGTSRPSWCAAAWRAAPYGEISEALFLTQSFAYESAEAADDRFAGDEPGFIYQRFGNPTTQMFEDRLALLEGAEVCRATASGMAAVQLALMGLLRAGDHLVAGPGPVRLVPLDHLGMAAAVRRRDHLRRRHRPRGLEERRAAQHQGLPGGEPGQSAAGGHRHRRGGRHRACGRREAGRRQRLRHADLPEAAGAGRRHRRLFGHQAHRRPGPGAGRGDPRRRRAADRGLQGHACATPARRCRRSTPGCC